jgi:hypothetical protein
MKTILRFEKLKAFTAAPTTDNREIHAYMHRQHFIKYHGNAFKKGRDTNTPLLHRPTN